MARVDEFNKSFEKPADRYIEWASDNQQFKYWDGDAQEEILIPLPLKFVVLMERHTIRGFNDDSNSRIYSNEVEDLSTGELTVKSFEGGLIAKGLYSSIKDAVEKAGGHYAKSIYIMMLNGEVWNINLKGSAVFAWGEFVKKDRKQLGTHSVIVDDFEQLKKGKIDYSVPVFSWGKEITSSNMKKADEVYDALVERLSSRAKSLAVNNAADAPEEEEEEEQERKPKTPKNPAKPAAKKSKPKPEPEEEEEEEEEDEFPDPNNMPDEAEVDF